MFSPIEGEGEPHASINYAEIGHTGVGREWSERFRPSTAYQSGTGERVTGSRQLMLLVRRHTATLGTVPSAAPQMNDLLDIIRSQQGQIGGDNQHIGWHAAARYPIPPNGFHEWCVRRVRGLRPEAVYPN